MEDLDSFFEPDTAAGDLVKLSHLNNKSSVLCPESQDITSQYLILQQLDAHQRMISRAKSTVDTSAPKSLQSYISVTDRQRKKSWRKSRSHSRDSNENYASLRGPALSSEEDDNVSLNASSVNKGVQTGIPFSAFGCITDDKISWYLDALRQGQLPPQSFFGASRSRNGSQQSIKMGSVNMPHKRVIKGDLMDWHSDSFVKPKDFSPRILANTNAKSKLKDMRCYNPPFRRRKKKSGSTHSSDTFESYENEDESGGEGSEVQKSSDASSIEDGNRSLQSESDHNPSSTLPNPALHGYKPKNFEPFHSAPILNRNEEDKYLNFLSKVTEDILRSGVYSDRAIQQAFEFHMQLYQEEANKDELQSLLNQILAGLKISEDESDELISRRNVLFTNFSRPNTPPEKESAEVLQSSELSRMQNNSNAILTEDGSLVLQSLEQTDVHSDVLQNDDDSDISTQEPDPS